MWALKKWSLNTGGLLIRGPVLSIKSFGTSGSGRSRQVVTEYKRSISSPFTCFLVKMRGVGFS